MKKIKALALISGGLDSQLAVKVIQLQNIEVEGISFVSPFFGNKDFLKEVAKTLGIKMHIIEVSNDYYRMIVKPKHGYGKAANPCIDCKIYMLKKAKKFAKKIGAKFIITGEILGQRPFSQNKKALMEIAKHSSTENILLRPLSAKLLPESLPEKRKLIDREKLYSIKGRSRKEQLKLAKRFGIKKYLQPAGGCLLTEIEFAKKFFDLIKHKKFLSKQDFELLKYGRHFRFGNVKIVVGRNKQENEILLKEFSKNALTFEVLGYGSPITLLIGRKSLKAIELAAKLTAFYSDCRGKFAEVLVNGKQHILVEVPTKEFVKNFLIR